MHALNRVGLIGISAGLLVLSGCATAAPNDVPASPVPVVAETEGGASSEIAIAVHDSTDGPEVGFEGVVDTLDGCLVFRPSTGDPVIPALARSDNPRWEDGKLTFGGHVFAAGDSFNTGGGYRAAATMCSTCYPRSA